jgi:hypothetical protein
LLLVSDQPAFWHLDAVRGPSTPSFNDLVGAGDKDGGTPRPSALAVFMMTNSYLVGACTGSVWL